MESVMHSLTEPSVADRRGLQMIGMALATLMLATTLIAAILVHRGPAGEDFRSSYGTSAQRHG
jgi:hypothetical protein